MLSAQALQEEKLETTLGARCKAVRDWRILAATL
jgi:hypothetical protein